MGGISKVHRWDGLRCYDIHTKFPKDWFKHSKVNGVGGFTDTQTAWWLHKPTFIFFFQNKESRLKYKKNEVLPVVLYRNVNCPLFVKKRHAFRTSENKDPWSILEPKTQEVKRGRIKLYNEGFHTFHSSLNIIRMNKSRGKDLRVCDKHERGKKYSICRILKFHKIWREETTLGDLGIDGRIKCLYTSIWRWRLYSPGRGRDQWGEGGSCQRGNESSDYKLGQFFWPAERIWSSQGLWSM
jgi:hypothetical protein